MDTRFLKQEGPDGLCVVAVLENDDREMIVWNDNDVPYEFFGAGGIDDGIAELSEVVHFGGAMIHFDDEQTKELIRFSEVARKTGCKCSIDLNLRVETRGFDNIRRNAFDQIIGNCDVVLGSGIEEFEPFTGINEFVPAAVAFSKIYADKTVIARDGPNDVLILKNGEYTSLPTIPTAIVNKVGAGDAFDAGFITAYAEGKSVDYCVRCGIAVASYAIGSERAHAAPTQEELEGMISSIKIAHGDKK